MRILLMNQGLTKFLTLENTTVDSATKKAKFEEKFYLLFIV